jgi:CheY-like chemotaxis protein
MQDDTNPTSVVAMPNLEPNRQQPSGERVLVVDDETYIIELLHSWLSFLGFDVRTASTGTDAVVVAAEFRPQLLVLDVMLPDIEGFELCRQIRQGGERAGVVLLTARNGREDTVAGLSSNTHRRLVHAARRRSRPTHQGVVHDRRLKFIEGQPAIAVDRCRR